MNLIKYYDIIVRGNARGGVLYAPPSWPRPIAIDGEDVKNWQSLVVELKYGPYRNFNMCVGNANIQAEPGSTIILNNGGQIITHKLDDFVVPVGVTLQINEGSII